MEKPIRITIEETKSKLINVINESSLPDFVLLPIIKDLYVDIENAYKENYYKQKLEFENINKDGDE